MQSWIQFRNKNKPTPGRIRSDKLRRLRGVNVQCRPTEPGGRSGTAGEPPQAPAAGVLGQFERRRRRDPDRALHMADDSQQPRCSYLSVPVRRLTPRHDLCGNPREITERDRRPNFLHGRTRGMFWFRGLDEQSQNLSLSNSLLGPSSHLVWAGRSGARVPGHK
jgi:hypothetical protein